MSRSFSAAGAVLLLALAGCNFDSVTANTSDGDDAKPKCPTPVESPPFPKAEVVDSPEYNFGAMEANHTGKHTFQIVNRGDAPLELVKKGTTCKCTLSGMDKNRLNKGETATVELEWTPPGVRRDFHQHALICTNDPKNAIIELTVYGQVVPKVEVSSDAHWMAQSTGDNSGRKRAEGRIYSAILKQFKIKKIDTGDSGITAKVEPIPEKELSEISAKVGYKIALTVPAKGELGHFEKKVTLKTDVGDGTDYYVTVIGTRQGPVTIVRADDSVPWDRDSMRLSLGEFSAKKGASASLMWYVSGLKKNEQLKIEKFEAKPDFVTYKLEPMAFKIPPPDKKGAAKTKQPGPAKKRYRLTVSVPPGKIPSAVTSRNPGQLVFTTNHPDAKTIRISLTFYSY